MDLGLSAQDYVEGTLPKGWHLRRWSKHSWNGEAGWVIEDGVKALRLHSDAALSFVEKRVDIDLRAFPEVSWQWKVDNILQDIDERTHLGDDHPIRLFFVFDPDPQQQSLWFRIKRHVYLDWVHGHPYGGRFIEYLWSSHLERGEVIDDPGKPWQKLMVIEGGTQRLGKWLSYKRNLYQDYMDLYGEEPRRLIFIGILNDTDQTGQQATSYVTELKFHPINTLTTSDSDDISERE